MAGIDIYCTPTCGFCFAAKRLLDSKGVEFNEIDLTKSPDQRIEMTKRAEGAKTVPQIFINDIHVGGCDDLYALERAGKLDELLSHENV